MRSDRFWVDHKMFQAFAAENQELVKRYQELLGKLNSLRDICNMKVGVEVQVALIRSSKPAKNSSQ